MKVCAVTSCRKDSTRCPGVIFFNLPRDPTAKGEWLDALGLKNEGSNVKVCDAHFRSKDFCAGKRQLKTHAVPALNLRVGKTEPLNSDDEFMQYDSDNEILAEVKKFSCTTAMNRKIKEEYPEEKPQEEQEPETGRRPSRRAAREAAKKIYNTVCNYGNMPDADDPDVVSKVSKTSTPRPPRQRQRSYQNIKIPPPNIDLVMECHEELLSTVQAEALLQAQLQYNMVMKTLRSLKASNVKITVAPADDPVPVENSNDDNENNNNTESDSNHANISPCTNNGETIKNENGTVYPMELSTDVQSPAPSILS